MKQRWLVRFGTRPIYWEQEASPRETLEGEFSLGDGSPDLNLSVFELERSELVAALAQFSATHFEPPQTCLAINVGDAGRPVVATLGDTSFELTRRRHRELRLPDRHDLENLVTAWRTSLESRSVRITRQQLYDYVREQLRVVDVEWRDLLDSGKPKRWVVKQAHKV